MTDTALSAPAAARPVRPNFLARNRDKFTDVLYPVITFAVLLLIWEIAVRALEVPDYIFPQVGPVFAALKEGYIDGTFYPHLSYTLQSTLAGYAIGCVSAIILGAVLAESRTFEKFFYPFVIAMQSTPKVAIAPLMMVWFGYGLPSKIAMVALMCFFPLFVNTLLGVRQTDQQLVNMMRSFSAPEYKIFFRVKLFSAAGHIFAGLQISIVLALIGAVVGEFVSSARGLGWLIQTSMATFNTPMMFAAIISLIVIGVLGTAIVRSLHSRLIFWDRSGPRSAH